MGEVFNLDAHEDSSAVAEDLSKEVVLCVAAREAQPITS